MLNVTASVRKAVQFNLDAQLFLLGLTGASSGKICLLLSVFLLNALQTKVSDGHRLLEAVFDHDGLSELKKSWRVVLV